MSFAYKLWKIGRALTEEEIWESMTDSSDDDAGEDRHYVNIDFTVSDGEITDILLKKESIEKDKLLFTYQIHGSGQGIVYLYPNIAILNDTIEKKIIQIINTLNNSVMSYANEGNKKLVEKIIHYFNEISSFVKNGQTGIKRKIIEIEENSKIDLDIKKTTISLLKICLDLILYPKASYWLWLSVNGKTFYELMPEIKEKWFNSPFLKCKVKRGYDSLTNKEDEVGYIPDVRVFSYDQYHESLHNRLAINLPLSLESARHIKFAWLFIQKNLVFYYNSLEYVVIPNLFLDDVDMYRTVLKRFKMANKKSQERSTLEKLNAQEKKLEKLVNKKKPPSGSENRISDLNQKQMENGMIREFCEQIDEVGDLENAITIDYLFTKIDRKSKSFEIKGTLEDVIPSQIRAVVMEMNKEGRIISDHIDRNEKMIGYRDNNVTYLQDYFNRNELYFIKNNSWKINKNKALGERLYIAKLLLTDMKIDLDSLLERFRINRLYGYNMKKRLPGDKTSDWIGSHDSFSRNEAAIYDFFNSLNKIKG